MSFFLIITQACLFGATREYMISESPLTKALPLSLSNCTHHKCCGCRFYSNTLSQTAQSIVEAKLKCPFRTDSQHLDPLVLTPSFLFFFIKHTIKHFVNCLNLSCDQSSDSIKNIFEEIKVDITKCLILKNDIGIVNTILHEAAKDGDLDVLKCMLHLFFKNKLSRFVTSKAIAHLDKSPKEVAEYYNNSKCSEEIHGFEAMIRQCGFI